jgi:hypothetical protein
MREIRYVEGDKVLLYLPSVNSKWVGEIQRQNVMVLIIDNPYSSYECVKPSEIKQGFNSLEKYNGEKIIVNSEYIIKIFWGDLVSAKYEWGNSKRIGDLKVVAPEGAEVELLDVYEKHELYSYPIR